RMDPPQTLQLGVMERLHAEAQSIDTGVAETFQLPAIDRFGVRLERDFAVRIDSESIANRPDDGGDLCRIEQRRRSAAEVDRVDGVAGVAGAKAPAYGSVGRVFRPGDFPDERLDVARLQRLVVQPAIEIAVVADRRTERDVDVDTEGGGRRTEGRRV